jgi:prolyl oligopeptidase
MNDKYLWLEEIHDLKSLDWAKEKSQDSIKKITSHPWFNDIHEKALLFLGTKDKIPYVNIVGNSVYNFWTDDNHVQGIYRKTTIDEFLKISPSWEIILDLDDLSKKENTKWVLAGFELNDDESRSLVFLSPGGSDANIMREFNLHNKEFVKDGFALPESKGQAHWLDDNTLRLARNFDDASVTNSGYARTVRDWKRGEPLESAKIIFEIEKNEIQAYPFIIKTLSQSFQVICKRIDFYKNEDFIFENGSWVKLNIPSMSESYGVVGNQYLVLVKEDWNSFLTGDVLAYDLKTHQCKKIFSCAKNESIFSISRSKSGFYAIIDEDVKSTLYKYTLNESDNWSKTKIELPTNGSLDYFSTDYRSDKFFIIYSSFNQPATYYFGEENKIICSAKTSPSFFNHNDVIVEQYFATSLDGTRVPYFVVYKKGTSFNGSNPTILYGYGGFEVSLKPTFNNRIGSSWIDRGGVYVLANTRGGGEYGPLWHQSALKEKRHKAYEDFFAVAEDLISRNITSNKNLGIMGASNGGLLMGVCYTQRPDLFKAINCGVPLLDMHRFHKLLAGASWVAEYGNPDDEQDGAYIRAISPYQNIKENEKYPVIFLNTSTKDDRVHPGHARKFAAKLYEFQHPVYYYENIVGGHSGASNFKESAFLHALDMCFFWQHLK